MPLDHLAHRVFLERVVTLVPRVLQGLLVLQVKKERRELQVHLASRDYLVLQDHLERVESPENPDKEVKMEPLEPQAIRVKMAFQVNVVDKVLQVLQEQEVEQVPLAQKVARVLLVHLVPLVVQGHLVCKECQEREEVMEILDPKEKRENLVAEVVMASLVKMDQGVLQVPLGPQVQLAHMEIRENLVQLALLVQ